MVSESNIHIGSIIEKEFRRQNLSVQWFAEQLCYERSNIYRIFRSKSIDTESLYRISTLLNYNFFALYQLKDTDKNTADVGLQ